MRARTRLHTTHARLHTHTHTHTHTHAPAHAPAHTHALNSCEQRMHAITRTACTHTLRLLVGTGLHVCHASSGWEHFDLGAAHSHQQALPPNGLQPTFTPDRASCRCLPAHCTLAISAWRVGRQEGRQASTCWAEQVRFAVTQAHEWLKRITCAHTRSAWLARHCSQGTVGGP